MSTSTEIDRVIKGFYCILSISTQDGTGSVNPSWWMARTRWSGLVIIIDQCLDCRYQREPGHQQLSIEAFPSEHSSFSTRGVNSLAPGLYLKYLILSWHLMTDILTIPFIVLRWIVQDLFNEETPPMTWTNIDLSLKWYSDIHRTTISKEIPQPSMTKVTWKVTYLKIS